MIFEHELLDYLCIVITSTTYISLSLKLTSLNSPFPLVSLLFFCCFVSLFFSLSMYFSIVYLYSRDAAVTTTKPPSPHVCTIRTIVFCPFNIIVLLVEDTLKSLVYTNFKLETPEGVGYYLPFSISFYKVKKKHLLNTILYSKFFFSN